jgi:hypothetical protein
MEEVYTETEQALNDLRYRVLATNVHIDVIAASINVTASTIYRFLNNESGLSIQNYFALVDFCRNHDRKIANTLPKRKRHRVKKRGELLSEIAPV